MEHVTIIPVDWLQLRSPGLEQWIALCVDGLALFSSNQVRFQPVATDRTGVRKCRLVEKRDQAMKGIRLALVRRGREEQKIRRGFRQPLTESEPRHLVRHPAQAVRFINHNQIPVCRQQIFVAVPVVLSELFFGPPAPVVDRLHGVHRADDLVIHFPDVVLPGDAPESREVARQQQPELFTEVSPHLGRPLAHQAFRSDHKNAADQPTQLHLLDDQTGLDGFAKSHFVCQKQPYAV